MFIGIEVLINFSQERGARRARGEEALNVGHGIGMAIGLFIIIIFTSLMQHQVCFHVRLSDLCFIFL